MTREASDMVLVDDNYETIIGAVREGRAIYENIRKFIRYLLGCNVGGEVLTMLMATLLGLPLPLVPMQILWMNLVTDGLPAIALGLDDADGDLLLQPPRHPGGEGGVFARGLLVRILFFRRDNQLDRPGRLRPLFVALPPRRGRSGAHACLYRLGHGPADFCFPVPF